ncbi:MAG TPA: hypothetical protein VIM56_00745 [Rhizomicrobium sp.]
MTVANVVLEPHCARLVQDTLSYWRKKPYRLNRKIKIVSQSQLVFTVRGNVAISDIFEDLDHNFRDFETALSIMSHAIEEMPREWFKESGAEVTVLAWEGCGPKASRIKISSKKDYSLRDGRLVNDSADNIGVERFDLVPGVYLAPSLGRHDIRSDLSDEQLLKIAILQQEISLRHKLNMCVGGDIEIATIDASGVSVRTLGEYPNKALTIAQIGKLNPYDVDSIAA